jgi:hypothetical protein
VEAIVQNAIKIGNVVRIARNRVVHRAPPSWRARYQGTIASKEQRRILLNVSLPEASAGRGAFFMAGYYPQISNLMVRQDDQIQLNAQKWCEHHSPRLVGLASALLEFR